MSTCYTIGYDYVSSSNQYFPCTTTSNTSSNSGPHAACCYGGDFCMQDSICHYTHSANNGTGYYLSGCTDPTWQDPACPRQCAAQYGADIMYDPSSEAWKCCVSSAGHLNCADPTNVTIAAPAPNALVLVAQLTQSLPSQTTMSVVGQVTLTTATTSATSTATTTPTSSASSSSSLSPGGIAGLIAGIFLLLILTLTLYLLHRRRLRTHNLNTTSHNNPYATSHHHNSSASPIKEEEYIDSDGNKFIVSAATAVSLSRVNNTIPELPHSRRTSSDATLVELHEQYIQEKDGTPVGTPLGTPREMPGTPGMGYEDAGGGAWGAGGAGWGGRGAYWNGAHALGRGRRDGEEGTGLVELAGDYRTPVELPGCRKRLDGM